MIATVFYIVLAMYAIAAIRATKPARAASVVAFAGGDTQLVRNWATIGPRYTALAEIFARVGREQKIPASLLAGIAWVESDFVATARNTTTQASGLMQVMPSHFSTYGLTGDGWKDPYKNITAGARILRESGYGRRNINRVLANYGGFVTVDPSDYIDKVLSRASFLAINGGALSE